MTVPVTLLQRVAERYPS